jgi:hypothetical protein
LKAEKLASRARFAFLSLIYQENKDSELLDFLIENLKDQVFNDKIQQHIAIQAVPVFGPLIGMIDE